MIYSLDQIQKTCRGRLISENPFQNVRGFCIDSRILKKGQAFIAIRGKSQDGHQYIPDVIKRGAGLVIADHNVETAPVPLMIVKDTTRALGEIARMHRRQFKVPVVALTGSAGKTTTKEMIAAVLSKKFKALKNYKNENNWYGVPLTLLKLNASHQIVVLEMGTNQPGDMAWMSYVGEPDVVVLTNVGESHLEKLKTPAGVFKEKSQILKCLSPKGTVILNQDDRFWSRLKVPCYKKISYGLSPQADVHGQNVSSDGLKQLTFKSGRTLFKIRSPFQHNIHNALAAIACGQIFKISIEDIQDALAKFKFEGGRQDIQKIKGVIVINDTYNSNPLSFRSAVQTLDVMQVKGKKVLVCADMKELGPKSVQLHQSMANVIRKTSIDAVFSFGDLAQHITTPLAKTSMDIQHFTDIDQLCHSLKPYLRPGNAVLIKGSRSMRMERVAEAVKAFGMSRN